MSRRTRVRPATIFAPSTRVSTPTFASMRACAIEPSMSCGYSRQSMLTDSVKVSTSRSVSSSKRPPQSFFFAAFMRGGL
ncbi:hypothetical protein D3C83_102430 [compost metagenome]